jgi:hypothetical protein
VRQTISRRDFLAASLKTTLGACSLATLYPLGLPAASAVATRGNLRLGFTTYEWGKDWIIPTLIANLQKAQVFGAELRTSASHAHGVELALSPEKRREVKKRFANTPIALLGLASGESMDWPEPEKLKAAIDAAKAHVKLSHDVGGSGVRVFPNHWHPNVPHEKTIEQIARALNDLGAFGADYGQEIRLEAHGSVGELPTLRAIMDQVKQPGVRLKLNSEERDTEGEGFEANFNLVKELLGHTLHLHNLKDPKFPYQLQVNLLAKMNWDGWGLLEVELADAVPDRVQGLIEFRQIWEQMVAKAMHR